MTRRHGKNVGLGRALDSLVGRLDRRTGGAGTSAKVATLWAEVAGPMVSSHTTGVHLRNNDLVVYVDSHAWASDLSALSEQYRGRMNEGLGKELVRSVVFTVSRKVADERVFAAREMETEEFYREDDVEPVPLTDLERRQVEASVQAVPGEELREAVLRATVKDLEWKKGIALKNSREKA